jgi:hypothetical protein
VTEELSRMFRVFERDFAGESPLYQRLSGLLAERTDLATPLLSAPHGQRRALLLFAAVQQILRVREPGHRLAEWYPSLGGTRSPHDPALLPAFADLVHQHQAEITEWCRSRTTQTNEVRRAALLRPALGFAADLVPGPLALIELGCSAGLLLVPDRYAFRYYNADRSVTYGTGYEVDCEARGAAWPAAASLPIVVGSRIGIDLAPVRPSDTDGVNWLRSCIWPEHLDRVARLDAAIEVVAEAAPPMIAGNFVDELAPVLDAVPPDQVPCVFTSHALAYLRSSERGALLRLWDAVGRTRDLIVIVNENPIVGLHAFAPDAVADDDLKTPVTAVVWRDGQPTVTVLAHGGPHGNYLIYGPWQYAYDPPLLRTEAATD